MAIKNLKGVVELLEEVCGDLQTFNFDVPSVEPRDDASADEWREHALEVTYVLSEIEKLVNNIQSKIEG